MRPPAVGIWLVSALVTGVAASGCGGQARAGAPAPATAPHLISRPWTLRSVRDRVVVIRYTEGDCWGPGQVRTTERRTSVTIELLQSSSAGQGLCPHFLLGRELQIRLQAPLGTRRLLHAWVGAGPG